MERDREGEKEPFLDATARFLVCSSCLDVRLSLSSLIAIVRAQVSVSAGIFRET